jgi:hypothetical protein
MQSIVKKSRNNAANIDNHYGNSNNSINVTISRENGSIRSSDSDTNDRDDSGSGVATAATAAHPLTLHC